METDPTLCRDLEELLEPKGDPMSLVKWTTHSLTHLVKVLGKQGHTIKKSALAELLHELGYSRHPRTRKRLRATPTPTAISSLSTSIRCVSSSSRSKRPRSQ